MKKRILLIEDNDELRENTAEIIELANYEVLTAPNGKVGLEIALDNKVDLIVCDIMMPVLDGYGVLHSLQKNESTRNIPFIFLSAKSEKDDWRKGMELGADDYVTKPFTGSELLVAIDRRLEKRDLLRQDLTQDKSESAGYVNQIDGTNALENIINENVNYFKKKEVIYREGNKAKSLYFIQKGKVKTFKTNEEGKELVMDILGEGDYFGYLSILGESIYTETAESMEDAEISEIPLIEFNRILQSDNQLLEKFIRILSKNVIEKENHLLSIAYNSLRKKVAEALLICSEKFNPHATPSFSLNVSRENLASIAGTATESTIRTLSDFKEEKLIEIKEGKIIIQDEKRLRRLVN
ncbi:MAG: response regulator [Chitinophagales bacterium]|nr:response regulator [Chitinophagales bacterium]